MLRLRRVFARSVMLLVVASVTLLSVSAEAKGRRGGATGSGKVSSSVHTTRSYVKKNGTVVRGYKATNPNGTQRDNFSAKGNVNPYTGKAGTKAVTK